MSCSIKEFRDKKIKEAVDLVYNPLALAYRQSRPNSIVITPGGRSKIKNLDQAYKAAEAMEKKIAKKFGTMYNFKTYGKWTTIFKSPSIVRLEVNIPQNLLKAYKAREAKKENAYYATKTAEIEQQQKGQLSFFDSPTKAAQFNKSEFAGFKEELAIRTEEKIQNLRAENKQKYNGERAGRIRKLETLKDKLEQDVEDVKSSSSLDVIAQKIKEDLDALDVLLGSAGIEDIHAAEEIISYYLNITDYSYGAVNSFLNKAAIYDEKENLNIDPALKDMLEQTLLQINDKYSTLGVKKQKWLEEKVLASPEIQKLVDARGDKSFNVQELLENIDDIGMISGNLLTIDKQFSGGDSLLSQLMKIELELSRSIEKSKAARINKEIDLALEQANSKIPNMNPKESWFNGRVVHKDFSMFYQKSKLGKRSAVLVNKFTSKWDSSKDRNFIKAAIEKRKGTDVARNKANKMNYDWIDSNSNWIQPSLIPRIISDPQYRQYVSNPNDAEALAYEAELIAELGEDYYNEIVKEQILKLNDFDANSQWNKAHSNPFKLLESRENGDAGKTRVGQKEIQIDPRHNTFYPKKYIEVMEGNTLVEEESGYYDNDFRQIEQDVDLKRLWKAFSKSAEYINDTVTDAQTRLVHGSTLSMKKSFTQMLLAKTDTYKAAEITDWLIDSINKFFSQTKEKKNASESNSINKTQFKTNNKLIQQRMEVFFMKFKRTHDYKEMDTIDLMAVPQKVLDYLAVELNITPNRNNLSQMLGKTLVTPHELAIEAITDQVNDENSANLPVLMRAYTEMTAEYKAQKESQPRIEIFKQFYDNIKKKKLSKTRGKYATYALDFLRGEKNIGKERVVAKRRLNYWYNKNVKGGVDSAVSGPILSQTYSDSEYDLIFEYKKQLEDPKITDKEKEEIENKIEALGMNVTVAAAYDSMINKFALFKGLAYSVKSATINRFQGWFQGAVQDGRYWSEGNFDVANSFIMRKVQRFIDKDFAVEMEKAKLMVNALIIIQDATNEMDRAAETSGYRGLAKRATPYYLTEYTEWHNQTPQILAMLMDKTIVDKNGNVKRIFDGKTFPAHDIVDGTLQLKPEFRDVTINGESNKATWENFSNTKAGSNKLFMSEVIGIANGDYSKTGGIMIKQHPVGRTLMLFQTWLPNYIWARIANNQTNLILGKPEVKGMYNSHRPGTLGLTLGIVGLTAFGPWGLAIAGLAGFIAGAKIKEKQGLLHDASLIKETAFILGVTLKKLGAPVNMVTGYNLWEKRTNYASIAGKAENKEGDLVHSTQDMANLDSVLTELSVLLSASLMKIMMKSMLANDDEEEPKTLPGGGDNPFYLLPKDRPFGMSKDTQTAAHNLLENEIGRIMGDIVGIQSIGFYKSRYETFQAVRVMEDAIRLSYAIAKWGIDEDRISTGVTTGESRLGNSTKRLFVPGIFQSPLTLGYEKTMSREYDTTEYFDRYFWSDYKKHKKSQKFVRDDIRADLTDELKHSFKYDDMGEITRKVVDGIITAIINDVVNVAAPYDSRIYYDEEQMKLQPKAKDLKEVLEREDPIILKDAPKSKVINPFKE